MTGSSRIRSIKSARDVVLFRLDGRKILVVSCDAAGAIGSKHDDALRIDPATVGKFTVRVALMENVAVGAKPLCVSMTLCVEPMPTGREILKGVRHELKAAGLGEVTIVQSSEKNFPVLQTGVGATVTGIVRSRELRVGRCERGDWIVVVGSPSVGHEVPMAERTNSIADLGDIYALLKSPFVHEMLPVGSRGILREARVIAADSKLRFLPEHDAKVDMEKSAGPATVVLCAISPSKWAELQEIIDKPLSFVGKLS